jgi:ubiquinone/menaquinone biosynthesis C-methylase UbiE
MNYYNTSEIVEYWKKIIREKRDPFRTYITDPALFNSLGVFSKPSYILDAGCGEGYVTRWLTQRNHTVIAIDASPQMVLAAQEMRVGTDTYIACDLTKLCFNNAVFDGVVSNFVLMEIEHLKDAISEISRVMKLNGRLIFQILHPCYSFSLLQKSEFSNSSIDYFTTQKITKNFCVDGLESPSSVTYFHRPLREYIHLLDAAGFTLHSIEEPTITSDAPEHISYLEPKFLIFEMIRTSK